MAKKISKSKLEARVRSIVRQHASYPEAITVYVERGKVTLGGPILVSEVAGLLAAVEEVEGLQGVLDHLEVQETVESLQEAQGNGTEKSGRTLSPAVRILAGAAGGALALVGLKRRDKVGAALGGVGLGLLATGGIAGRNPVSLFRRSAKKRDPEAQLPEPVRNQEEVPVQGTEEGTIRPTRL